MAFQNIDGKFEKSEKETLGFLMQKDDDGFVYPDGYQVRYFNSQNRDDDTFDDFQFAYNLGYDLFLTSKYKLTPDGIKKAE